MSSYKYNADGKIIAVSAYDNLDHIMSGDEPFDLNTANDFKLDLSTNKFVSTKIDYQYIIIPTGIIPNIKSMVQLVEDVLTDQAFVIYLSKEEVITRNNQKRDIGILPISFTPCTVIEWDNGDDARLQSIIDQFNREYKPPREIDFPCKFDSLQDLEQFKQSYCYI